ncbi:MAG: ribonuclease J [Acidobacteria bacterium]|nr:ribonuclease J [Acidobacteriota bacterium]
MVSNTLEVIPLGGIGEFGMNMMVVRYGDDMIAIDCGLMFPEDGLPGVDFVIPDLTFIADNKHLLRAIVLTHGHEDHIGALPFVLKTANVPVYGTRFTLGLVEGRLHEHDLAQKVQLNIIKPRESFSIGPFSIEPVRVSHSLVDCVALAVSTPVGTIVHTGDFKVDETPVCGSAIDLTRLREIGDKGVLALFTDSTNAESPGRTGSEKSVIPAFEDVFEQADGKIVVTCFSSSIHRLQIIFDMAYEFHKKVAVLGRSIQRNVELGDSLRFLDIPDGLMINPNDIKKYEGEELVVIASGCQGEPASAMGRIAVDAHKQCAIDKGDTVVLSGRIIPGNERSISRMMGNIFKKGGTVVDSSVARVHVSGHPKQDDLRIVTEALRPKFYIPIHGEPRQLFRHKDFVVSAGLVTERNVLMCESGDVIALDSDSIRVHAKVLVGRTFIDSTGMEEVAEMVVRDRRNLSYDGFVMPIVAFNPTSGAMETDPELVTVGFMDDSDKQMLTEMKDVLESTIKAAGHDERTDGSIMKDRIRISLKRHIQKATGRRPVIIPVIMEI